MSKKPRKITPRENIAKEAMGVEILTVPHGANGYRFALETKIKVAEFCIANDFPLAQMGEKIGITGGSLGHWVSDYKEGKYNLGNVTQINRKEMRNSFIVLQDLNSLESQKKILELKLEKLKQEGREALARERKLAEDAFGKAE